MKDLLEKDTDLGRTNTIKMSIDNVNHPHIKLRPYRTPFVKCPIVDKTVNDMLTADTVHPSRSPQNFPIVVVDKKDGTKRFCTDFRRLSNISKKSSWPPPVLYDMLATLGKAKYLHIYLKSGYWQILVNEGDKEKIAFTWHKGLYGYNVMPFGLISAPVMFQELVSVALHGLGDFAIAYLDDIIIFSASSEEYKQHIKKNFDCLRKSNFKLELSKCKYEEKNTVSGLHK